MPPYCGARVVDITSRGRVAPLWNSNGVLIAVRRTLPASFSAVGAELLWGQFCELGVLRGRKQEIAHRGPSSRRTASSLGRYVSLHADSDPRCVNVFDGRTFEPMSRAWRETSMSKTPAAVELSISRTAAP